MSSAEMPPEQVMTIAVDLEQRRHDGDIAHANGYQVHVLLL